MAVINYNQKWLYLMEPHTASRAVTRLLKNRLKGSEVGHHHANVAELTNPRRRQISARAEQPDFDVLCTVRNPFDVLVTRWLFKQPKPIDDDTIEDVAGVMGLPFEEVAESDLPYTLAFSEWALTNIDHIVTDPLKGLYNDANVIMYYETIEEDLSQYFGTPMGLEWDTKHVTKGKLNYREYYQYQDELVTALTSKYEGFLRRYGYSVEYEDGNLDVFLKGHLC